MSDLGEKRAELILQQLDELPPLPALSLRVLETPDLPDDVRQLIARETQLTARVLQIVNSKPFDPSDAGNLLQQVPGDTLRDAVLAITLFETYAPGSTSKGGSLDRDEFWQHAVAVGLCGQLLAEALRGIWGGDCNVDPAEAFVCGVLHDLGKMALDVALPKSYGRVIEAVNLLRGNIADVERNIIGLDHMVVGKRLAERWRLPATIRDCMWLHGQLPESLPATVASARLVNLVTLADLIVREQHIGYSGNYSFPVSRQGLLDAIGLTSEQVGEATAELIAQIEPRAKALGLGQVSLSALYQQAISQVNQEIGRVSGQLEASQRRLAMRTKYFDALSGFQGELKSDAAPQAVLNAIGQTAVALIDIHPLGVFSLMPGQDYGEALLVNEAGEVFEHTLVDCPNRPATPIAGDGPVLAAGAELEWLLCAVSPRLKHDHRFWICLEAEGQCVGGVFWGAPTGEGNRLAPQVKELVAISTGWALALRTAQIREEARLLAEQLAEANRRLQNAQNELLRTKTMSTVGEMAAGAAHEMNNPLAVMSGRSQLLAQQLTDPKQKASAHLIYEQSHRVTDIISELMDFAKPVPPAPAETDLAELIDRALHEAKMQLDVADRSIEVTLSDIPLVVVDPQQVRSALMEVIDNALHATDPASGQVTVHAAFDPYSLRVVITVSDNGCGMDEHTLKRAFDPFFSSRKAGRRRGMGLAKALRWVEASGGSIRLESKVDQGTRVYVLLPAAKPVAAQTRTTRKAQ